MALPKAVQAQEDAANAHFEQGGNTAVAAPAPEQQAQPQQAQPAQPAVAAPAAGNTEIQALKHQMDVLQGKYNAEVPRLAQANRTLQEENETLKQQLEQKSTTTDMNGAVETLSTFLDEDGVEALRKLIRGEMAPVQQTVDQTRQEFTQTQEQTQANNHQGFINYLRRNVPNFDQVNSDQGFNTFLDNTARSGRTMRQLLNQASQSYDGPMVAEIFSEYANQGQRPDPLQQEVMPGRSGAGQQPNQQQRKELTGPEIDELYARVRRGEITEDQADALIWG